MLRAEAFAHDDADALKRLAQRGADDGVTLPQPLLDAAFVTRTEIRVNDDGQFVAFGLDLGEGITTAVVRAQVDQNEPKRVSVCSHQLGETDTWPAGEPGVTILPGATTVEFGQGWQAIEHLADGTPFRWTTDRAEMVLTIPVPRPTTLSIGAHPLNYPGRPDATLTVVLNGRRLESRAFVPGQGTLSWDVPARFWHAGLNEMLLEAVGARRPVEVRMSPDNRLLGVAVFRIDLNTTTAGTPPR